MNITKTNVKTALGFKTDTQLAEYFNVCNQAVSQWAEDKPLPIRRQLELRIAHPEIFKMTAPKIIATNKKQK